MKLIKYLNILALSAFIIPSSLGLTTLHAGEPRDPGRMRPEPGEETPAQRRAREVQERADLEKRNREASEKAAAEAARIKAEREAAINQINGEQASEFGVTQSQVDSSYADLTSEWNNNLKNLSPEVIVADLVDSLKYELEFRILGTPIPNTEPSIEVQNILADDGITKEELLNLKWENSQIHKQRVRIILNQKLRILAERTFSNLKLKQITQMNGLIKLIENNNRVKEIITNLTLIYSPKFKK